MKYQEKVGLPSILHCMRIKKKGNSGVFLRGLFSYGRGINRFGSNTVRHTICLMEIVKQDFNE
jgi:hypothetical protein